MKTKMGREKNNIKTTLTRRKFLKTIATIGVVSITPLCLLKPRPKTEIEIEKIKQIFQRCQIDIKDSIFKIQPANPVILLDYSPSDRLEMNSCTTETKEEAKEKAEKLKEKGYHTFIYLPEATGEGESVVTEEIATCQQADRRLYLLTHEAMHHHLEDNQKDWRETLMLEEAATHCFAIKMAKTVAEELYNKDSEEVKQLNTLDKGYHDQAVFLKQAGEAFEKDKEQFQKLAEKAYSIQTFTGGCGEKGASEYNPDTLENTVRFAIAYTHSLYPLMEELYQKEGCNRVFATLKEAMQIATEINMKSGIAYIERILDHKEHQYTDVINIWGHHKEGAEISCNDLENLV